MLTVKLRIFTCIYALKRQQRNEWSVLGVIWRRRTSERSRKWRADRWPQRGTDWRSRMTAVHHVATVITQTHPVALSRYQTLCTHWQHDISSITVKSNHQKLNVKIPSQQKPDWKETMTCGAKHDIIIIDLAAVLTSWYGRHIWGYRYCYRRGENTVFIVVHCGTVTWIEDQFGTEFIPNGITAVHVSLPILYTDDVNCNCFP